MRKLLFVLALAACRADNTPPPMTKAGKCLADVYEGARPLTLGCTMSGYDWGCTWNAQAYVYSCVRKGEAKGER